MRQRVDVHRLTEFLRLLAGEADQPVRVYLTGGATAVVYGWRESTIDIDLCMVPESERMLRAIPTLKEKMQINIELTSPAEFIPELPGWETRSLFIRQEGQVAIFHYDLYAQAPVENRAAAHARRCRREGNVEEKADRPCAVKGAV